MLPTAKKTFVTSFAEVKTHTQECGGWGGHVYLGLVFISGV